MPGAIIATPPLCPVYISLDQKAAIDKVVFDTTMCVFLPLNPMNLPELSFVSKTTVDALHQVYHQSQACPAAHQLCSTKICHITTKLHCFIFPL